MLTKFLNKFAGIQFETATQNRLDSSTGISILVSLSFSENKQDTAEPVYCLIQVLFNGTHVESYGCLDTNEIDEIRLWVLNRIKRARLHDIKTKNENTDNYIALIN